MRVPEEPVCSDLFRKNPVFTSMHLKSPVHVVPHLSNNDGDGETHLFNNALPAQIHTNILKPSKIIGKTIDPRYLMCVHKTQASTVQKNVY